MQKVLKPLTIYGIYDATGDLRYVGQTRSPLWYRLAGHLTEAHRTHPRREFSEWIFQTYSAGGSVTIAPLKLNARHIDERLIIERMLKDGHDLLNVDHTPKRSAIAQRIAADPKAQARRSAASSAAMTPARRAMVSATFKGKPKSPEQRALIGAANKAAYQRRKEAGLVSRDERGRMLKATRT